MESEVCFIIKVEKWGGGIVTSANNDSVCSSWGQTRKHLNQYLDNEFHLKKQTLIIFHGEVKWVLFWKDSVCE